MLYSFTGKSGQNPQGTLLVFKGVLYGTAFGGGAKGDGVVFSIEPSGKHERLLHSFGPLDGINPQGGPRG